MTQNLPSGTVTFLFTDIEGSTRLLHALGEKDYAEALSKHRQVLRKAFADHSGIEVDTQGDAFFVAFRTAPEALSAARQGTEAFARGPIRVRMGLHTGAPLVTAEGYVGEDVHRAARIAATGHGGQVLVSAATAALLRDADLIDLGEHRLKDLAAPERVYQLGSERFPPLKSLFRSNLPIPSTPFLGRRDELAEVVELVKRGDIRLLTLSGPGGTGKTRLALQAVADASEDFPDGIWWVPLAPLREADLILPTVVQMLGLKASTGAPSKDTLMSECANKRALILLDNCEHLLPGAAEAITVLRDLGEPMVVVTSRERLRIRGEQTYQVPPLSEQDGMSLFVARAKSVDQSFEQDPAISDLCAALDELPLAIELAAARTVVFTPAQLQERLGQRLDLFKGDRDADPRQRTLRATIEWSYGLLSGSEQDLFRRFGVFAGGSSYEAVERICHVDADTLGSLIDKSLLLRRESETGPRFWMLETIREFALERLAAAGEEQDLRDAHATWFSKYVAELCWPVRENETGARPALLADLPNARAALAHAVSRRDLQLIGDCLFGLWWQWLTEGFSREGKAAVEVWLDVDRSELTDMELVPGLLACGEILRFTGDTDHAAELKGQLLAIARAHPGEAVHSWSMDWMIPALLSDLSQIELARGHLADARSIASEALSIRRHSRERRGIGHALVAAGIIDIVSGDSQAAHDRFAEAAEALEGTSDSWMARLYAAECEVSLGDLAGATEHLRACLEQLRQAPSVVDLADAARVSAGLAIEIGEHEVASELLGAFSRMSEDAGMPISIDAHWSHDHRRMTDLLRATLGEGGLDAGSRRGTQLTEEETLDLASLVTSLSV